MYSNDVTLKLEKRIRWNTDYDTAFPVALDEFNATGESGKHFQGFHQLVTLSNIYNVGVSEINMEAAPFNAILTDIRKQAVLQMLNDVFDKNMYYDGTVDYSPVIEANIGLFDNAIGFGTAISVLELMLSSKRINADERNTKTSAANLKLELEGFTNENGVVVAKGIRFYYQRAIKAAVLKIFPTKAVVNGKPLQ